MVTLEESLNPFHTGESEEFSLVKITDEELTGLKDHNGDIQFGKVLELLFGSHSKNIDYSDTFHPIDKENGTKVKYTAEEHEKEKDTSD